MANYQYSYGQYNPPQNQNTPQAIQQMQSLQAQQFFPTPQGSVYLINNSIEVGNIPMGSGISAAICFNEGLMYLKALHNGSPVFMPYKIMPYEEKPKEDSDRLAKIEERLLMLEQSQSQTPTHKQQKGGGLDGLI